MTSDLGHPQAPPPPPPMRVERHGDDGLGIAWAIVFGVLGGSLMWGLIVMVCWRAVP